ncbi:LysR family transcriptional regulator [Brucella haematophila]|uniref:LysR family transcriptional regulator n=1 Tax=Brucella haematophila TaxID=419474 RepID=A0ABX1DQ31_9HYPH|nr:LysR family transcriptional regulator [Brucella haematophila]NKC05049.1 LysR family transcriptional regulator [Brucella haematophila]TMV04406.1 LysR family transcriptional regulator [Brucella haematophila]
MTLDLHHLRHFVAVAEELHFGRAAIRLHMAQPPLSQSIRRLEADLGFSLFERTRRHVELTPAGAVFLIEARKTLLQADEAVRIARRAASAAVAELSITFVSAALYHLLPETLRRFTRAHSKVAIRLDERPTDAQLSDIIKGSVDLGFVHPPAASERELHVETIFRDRFIVAIPESDDLARAASVSLSNLASRRFIMFPYSQGPVLHARITQACRNAGFLPDIVQEARQMHTILSLVAAQLGVALIPSGARTMRINGVVFREIQDLPTDLVWELAIARRNRDSKKALQDFIAILKTVAVELS